MNDAVAKAVPTTPREQRAAWRLHGEKLAAQEISPTLRIGIAASFTVNSLTAYVGAHLLAAGLKPAIEVAPFNQIFQVCLDHRPHFATSPDVLVLIWRIEDLMLEETAAFFHGEKDALSRAMAKTALLGQAITNLRASFAGTIIVGVPPFPSPPSAALLDLDNATGIGAFHRAITTAFVHQLSSAIADVRFLDLDALQRAGGLAASYDGRQWYLYRQPFSERFLVELGQLLGRSIVALRQAPRKCVVLDCDNTLWGGIVGEDGVDGIQIGDEFPGSAYRDLQRLLLRWRQRGTLLAIASKNNEADVWEVFQDHPGMVLRQEHISTWQINWEPKAAGIVPIARALNIGTDSLVFLDDNPMEIDYMRAAHPEVLSLLLPEEPADIIETLQAVHCFDQVGVTEEDRLRAGMVAAEQQRETVAAQLSKEDFQRSLELQVEVSSADAEQLSRITQLINKTNQFNLSTIRRSLDEVRGLAKSPTHKVYGVRVTDRFGEYGLTGVVIAEHGPGESAWTIDTFLLSCRVLGRGVETAVLAAMADAARRAGAERMHAAFIPTAKNSPAAEFLPAHGFAPQESSGWTAPLSAIPAAPVFVSLVVHDAAGQPA